ncbi:hypothetical protein RJ640_010073 [Escallonia rubra]|uniref:Peptidase C1A papain C-terminal domain-containing protein n=1 Tax=Escallonia rubra TaxID=112253 RepID=A0AA88RWL9_9ASTE|nr:hypothetical protein RJ640_010073 [Escallonia rubra]
MTPGSLRDGSRSSEGIAPSSPGSWASGLPHRCQACGTLQGLGLEARSRGSLATPTLWEPVFPDRQSDAVRGRPVEYAIRQSVEHRHPWTPSDVSLPGSATCRTSALRMEYAFFSLTRPHSPCLPSRLSVSSSEMERKDYWAMKTDASHQIAAGSCSPAAVIGATDADIFLRDPPKGLLYLSLQQLVDCLFTVMKPTPAQRCANGFPSSNMDVPYGYITECGVRRTIHYKEYSGQMETCEDGNMAQSLRVYTEGAEELKNIHGWVRDFFDVINTHPVAAVAQSLRVYTEGAEELKNIHGWVRDFFDVINTHPVAAVVNGAPDFVRPNAMQAHYMPGLLTEKLTCDA